MKYLIHCIFCYYFFGNILITGRSHIKIQRNCKELQGIALILYSFWNLIKLIKPQQKLVELCKQFGWWWGAEVLTVYVWSITAPDCEEQLCSCLETSFSGGRNYLHGAVKQKCLKGLKDWKEKWFVSFQCHPVRSASGSDSKWCFGISFQSADVLVIFGLLVEGLKEI